MTFTVPFPNALFEPTGEPPRPFFDLRQKVVEAASGLLDAVRDVVHWRGLEKMSLERPESLRPGWHEWWSTGLGSNAQTTRADACGELKAVLLKLQALDPAATVLEFPLASERMDSLFFDTGENTITAAEDRRLIKFCYTIRAFCNI